MLIHQRFVPGLAINSYLIADERTGEAAVVDPTRDVGDFLIYARDHGLRISHILETHVHADFVGGSRELKARLDAEPVIHTSGLGGPEWTPSYADHVAQNGDAITLGAVRIEALHTPGHTPEHVSWAVYDTTRSADTPWVLLTGDFLLVGDVGRPDLLGAAAQAQLADDLYRSVFERLPSMPDITEVFPAHGAGSLCGKAIASKRSSTVGYERRFNAALAPQDTREAWIRALLTGMPLAPPYFRRMKQVNTEGPAILGPELPGHRRWSARTVYDRVCEECLVVDVRTKEAFAAAHIPNAINLPLGPNFATWAGWVLPYDRPILIVTDDPTTMDQVATHLVRVGFDDLRGSLDGGIDAWATSGFPIARLSTMSVHDLSTTVTRGGGTTILDVRTDREWQTGHIDGALHIHGGLLQERFSEVPRNRSVAVVCGSGYRASIAASFLKREHYSDVCNVIGGMSAWNAAGLPTTTA